MKWAFTFTQSVVVVNASSEVVYRVSEDEKDMGSEKVLLDMNGKL